MPINVAASRSEEQMAWGHRPGIHLCWIAHREVRGLNPAGLQNRSHAVIRSPRSRISMNP